jgi:hypothetical protein
MVEALAHQDCGGDEISKKRSIEDVRAVRLCLGECAVNALGFVKSKLVQARGGKIELSLAGW